MITQEQWIAWFPVGEESDYYEKISFLDCDIEGIIITFVNLKDRAKRMKLHFNGAFVSYRNTNETYMCEIQAKCSTQASFAYKVLNSNYKQWVSTISRSVSDDMVPNLQHFVFVSRDDYLEILTDCEPDVELVTIE